jgi:peptidoglycan/LPS O-acetylase OafA/YrhL
VTSAPSSLNPGSRILALDGLRGITIILVVLGHLSSFLWPLEGIRSTPYLRGLVGGGAVTMFFLISGLIVTSGLLREEAEGRMDPVRFLARRLVRVGAQVVPLCAALLLVALVDPTDTNTLEKTVRTVTNTLTYTNNLLYQTNPLGAREDMGHLWFLSIQMQWYLLVPLLVLLLARRRRVFAALVASIAVASMVYRLTTVSDTTWFALSIGTFARADALLLGVLLAITLPWLRRFGRYSAAVGSLACVGLFGLLLVSREGSPLMFLEGWGVAFTLTALVVVACVMLHERPSFLTRGLSRPSLVWLGQASLVIYVWHYPLIFWVGRHTPTWSWVPPTIVFLAMLAAVALASNRWVEQPVRAWLRTHLRPPQETTTTPVVETREVPA